MHVGGRDLANKSPDLSLLRIHPRKFESDSSCSFDHTLPTLPTQPTDPRGSPPLDSGLLGAGARRNAHSEHNERSGRSGCNGDTLQHLDQDRRHNRRTGSKACNPRTRLCSSLEVETDHLKRNNQHSKPRGSVEGVPQSYACSSRSTGAGNKQLTQV